MWIGPEFVPKVSNCLLLERVTDIIINSRRNTKSLVGGGRQHCVEIQTVYKCTQFVPKGLNCPPVYLQIITDNERLLKYSESFHVRREAQQVGIVEC